VNLKTIIIIALFVLVGVALCYFIGTLGDNLFTPLTATINGWIGGFNVSTALSNPATIITSVGAAAAVATPLLSKLSTAKQQVTDVTTQAKTQIGGLTTNLEAKTSQLNNTQLDLTTAQAKLKTLESSNSQLQFQADNYKTQLDKIMGQYTELQKIKSSDFLSTLPGGSLITNPDGSKTAVVERVLIK